jgi:hypothetical protein
MPLPIINLIQPKKLNLHVFYQRAQKIGSNYQVTTHITPISVIGYSTETPGGG